MTKYIPDTGLKDVLEELAYLGSPVDLTVCEDRQTGGKLEILQQGWVGSSRIFELESGCAVFMAELAVTNLSSKTVDIVEVDLQWPWKDELFRWLDPVEIDACSWRSGQQNRWVYRLGNLEFARDEVINEALIKHRKISGRRRVEGVLLGLGGRMAEGARAGQPLEVLLTIFTADNAEYSTTLEVFVERRERGKKVGKKRDPLFKSVDVSTPNGAYEPSRPPEPAIEAPGLQAESGSSRILREFSADNSILSASGTFVR
jgi:hypothetical protein